MKYKSIFISDLHLGSQGCQADLICDFLKNNQAEKLYLVGDIIDGWKLRRKIYWPQSHSNVIRRILTASKRGTKVYYILGNHDEVLRKWIGFDLRFGRIRIVNRIDHQGIDGKKYLVIHGDLFDSLMHFQMGKLLMHIGDKLYDWLLTLNNINNKIRGLLGFPYWSLSKYIKKNTKQALNFIYSFEEKLAEYAKAKGYDGVICGHIHTHAMKNIHGIDYMNSGDWVESCSALVENHDGTWQIIIWDKIINENSTDH